LNGVTIRTILTKRESRRIIENVSRHCAAETNEQLTVKYCVIARSPDSSVRRSNLLHRVRGKKGEGRGDVGTSFSLRDALFFRRIAVLQRSHKSALTPRFSAGSKRQTNTHNKPLRGFIFLHFSIFYNNVTPRSWKKYCMFVITRRSKATTKSALPAGR